MAELEQRLYVWGFVLECSFSIQRAGAKPFFLLETFYENEHGSTPKDLRRQAYSTVLSGGILGHIFGNCPIWGFGATTNFCVAGTWQSNLESQGSQTLAYVGKFFGPRRFYTLVPDQSHTVMTSGYQSGSTYAVTARTSSGSSVIAYIPTQRAVSIDMTKLTGTSALARWYNPRNDSFSTIGTYPTTGSQSFTPPDNNDWVLVIDEATPPVLSAVSTLNITSSGATMTWTTDEAADSQVEYGLTTAYGSTTTLNPTLGTSHSVPLSGLMENTTYHFRVKSKDEFGNLATGTDQMFLTLDLGSPQITGVMATNITGASATITWTTNEPADSQVEYGPTAAYGSTTPINPTLGTSHSVVLSGLTNNVTYHYRVKSRDAGGNLATGTDQTFLTSDTTPPQITNVTSTNITMSSATINWTTNEAADSQVEFGTTTAYGSTTTLDPTLVTSHGVPIAGLTENTTYHYRVRSKDAAGNLAIGSDQTFHTLDITPPQITAVSTTNITATSATITWSTNEAADSQVEFGTTTAYGSTTTLDPALVTSHGVPIAGLTENTTYHYRIRSKDAAGNLAIGSDQTFHTLDTTPPQITSVTATNITATTATINWSTNEAADRQVEYGTTTAYGSTTTLDPALVTSHGVPIAGLTENTTYHYRVKSKDASGNLATSSDQTFHTLDTTPPQITSVTATNITATTAMINWSTNEAADSQVEYGTTTAYGSTTTLDAALVTSHGVAIAGLTENTNYHYRVKSKDTAGNLVIGSDQTFQTPDPTAPQITAVSATNITATAATITWTTNEAADTQVEYGTTTAYGATTTLDSALVTSHAASLAGLAENTIYHYGVKSKDAAGNLATGSDQTFNTLDVTAPQITAGTATNITATGATITWSTNEAADSQVEYGLTTDYGSTTTSADTVGTSHSVTLSGLTENTT
jgi:hypothetical protein